MGRLFSLRAIGTLAATSLFLLGCTREVPEKLQLNIEVPTSLSSMVAAPKLTHVIVNMRTSITAAGVSGHSFDFEHNATVAQGSSVTLVVPGVKVPRSPTLFVQYLGVFEGEGTGMLFSYGSTTVNSDTNGAIAANIVATSFGSSTKYGRVMGRYMPTASPYLGSNGPSGIVKTYFKPPVANHPEVQIQEDDMFNGWFNLMVFDGVKMKYVVNKGLAGERVIFGGPVELVSFSAQPGIGKMVIPASYAPEHKGSYSISYVRPQPETEILFGYFGDGDGTGNPDTIPHVSGKYGCWPDPAAKLVPGVYLDPNLSAPMVFDNAGTTMDARADSSYGTSRSSGSCISGVKYLDKLLANEEWLLDSHDGPIGVRAPYSALNYQTDFSNHPEYLKARVVDNVGNPRIVLNWKYLPGVAGSSVNGTLVYMKNGHSGGGGGGDDRRSCNLIAQERGYTLKQDVASGAETVNIDTNVTGAPLTYHSNQATDAYNHSFLLCPYKDIAGGRIHYPQPIESGCMGGTCYNLMHVGLAVPSNLSNWPSPASITSYGGNSKKIYGVVSSNAMETTLASAAHAFNPGDEVIIRLLTKDGATACGTSEGNDIDGNRFHFARVLPTSDANNIVISSGSWVDGLPATGSASWSNTYGTQPFCSVRISRVVHTGDLNISSMINADPYDPATGGDGLIAVRSSGRVTFSSTGSLDVSARGYLGGVGPSNFGQGWSGGTGGNGMGGAGGGNGSDGGNGNAGSLGGQASSGGFYDQVILSMGSGGGGDYAGIGGTGGGSIFLVANELDNQVSVSPILVADGGMGAPGTGNEGAGGGAGGSVTLYANHVVAASMQPKISTNGGPGGSSATLEGGGGGGQGIIMSLLCGGISPVFVNNPGAGGIGNGGTLDGFPGEFLSGTSAPNFNLPAYGCQP